LISSIGLILDIIGAIIIFRFGLPENISRTGNQYIVTSRKDQSEIDKAKLYDFMSLIGISLLIIGFILQGIAN